MSAAKKKTNAEPGVHDLARAAFKKELYNNGWTVVDEGDALADRSYNGLNFYLTDFVAHPSKFEVKLRCERENLPQRLRPVVVPLGDKAPRKPRHGIYNAEQEAAYRKEWQEFGAKLARSVHRQLEIIDAQTHTELQKAEKERARADSRAIVAAAAQQKLQTQLETIGVNPEYAVRVHSGMDVQLPGGVTLRLSSTVRDWRESEPLTVEYTIDMNTHDTNQQGIVDLLRFLVEAGALEKK